jgi:hypothetical protein
MIVNEILVEKPNSTFKPGKYDWVPDKEFENPISMHTSDDLTFEHKGKEYKFKLVQDAAKKHGSLYRAGKGGKLKPVVRTLQAYLEKAGFNPGKIDGYYGKNTAKAVVQLQRELEVTEDGDVGPKTAAEMAKAYSRIIVGSDEASIDSNTRKADKWFAEHTKYDRFDEFFEDFKTRYLSMYRGMQIYLSDFPESKLSSEPELREFIANDLKDAHAYIQMGQKGQGLVYQDIGAWKRMVEIFSNIPWNKKKVDAVYKKRQEEQQRDLDKWTADQIGSKIGGTATRMSKGSAVDQYEPKKPKAPPSLVAPLGAVLSKPDIPDHSKYWKK